MKSTPTRGVKQYLKPNAYNQLEGLYGCIMGHRLGLTSKLKPLGVGVAKASLNRALSLWDQTRNRVI